MQPGSRHRKYLRDELYNLYWIDNKSLNQIASLYGVSHSTVASWMERLSIARRDLSSARKLWASSLEGRKHLRKLGMMKRKKFATSPSPALSYVLGSVLGDGCVWKYNSSGRDCRCRVTLCVKDRAFAEKFAVALKKIRFNPNICTRKDGLHQVQATSIAFYEWYKSLSPEQISLLIRGFEDRFVCGFYESEGSVYVHRGRLRVNIRNKRKELLAIVQNALNNWGIKHQVYGPYKNDILTLVIHGDERIEKFFDIVRPCIKTAPNKLFSGFQGPHHP